MWTPQQRYCTACALAVLFGFLLLAFYVDPSGLARLNPFGEECIGYEQQFTLSDQRQSQEQLTGSEGRETGAKRDARNARGAAPDQQSSQGDYYACRLAVYTRQLALFTCALVVATVILIGTGIYQGVHLGRAANAAKSSADALPAIERPYVLISGGGSLVVAAQMTHIPQPAVFYSAGNYGRTPAIIENVRAGYSRNNRGRPDTPSRVEETHPVSFTRTLKADREFEYLWVAYPEDWATTDLWAEQGPIMTSIKEPAIPPGQELFLRIIINYRGAFTIVHETSICWRYDTRTHMFLSYGSNEYNYER